MAQIVWKTVGIIGSVLSFSSLKVYQFVQSRDNRKSVHFVRFLFMLQINPGQFDFGNELGNCGFDYCLAAHQSW